MPKKRQTKAKAAKPPRKCDSYEEVARYLLEQFAEEFGLDRVEGKQPVPGLISGTTWTIDAKGVEEDGGDIIVECRRHTKVKANQEEMGGLAWRIIDTGAAGGIYVNPLGLQEGAELVAKAKNIIAVQLDPNSTPHDFVIGFLGKFRAGKTLNLFTSGTAPDFPSKTGGGFFICGDEPDVSPPGEGDSETHEAS